MALWFKEVRESRYESYTGYNIKEIPMGGRQITDTSKSVNYEEELDIMILFPPLKKIILSSLEPKCW